jgi:hypothetical protein
MPRELVIVMPNTSSLTHTTSKNSIGRVYVHGFSINDSLQESDLSLPSIRAFTYVPG